MEPTEQVGAASVLHPALCAADAIMTRIIFLIVRETETILGTEPASGRT